MLFYHMYNMKKNSIDLQFVDAYKTVSFYNQTERRPIREPAGVYFAAKQIVDYEQWKFGYQSYGEFVDNDIQDV